MGMVATEGGADAGWVRRIVIGRNPRFTLLRVAIWVIGLFLISRYVLLPVRVDGVSMLPTYRERGVNLVSRLAYLFHPPRRGDVVGIKLAGAHVMLMKRIIALPGETLEFREGRAVINGEVLPEPYLKLPCNWETPPLKIEPGEYYVVGDNRSMDFHLHTQGRAWRNQIIGKVLL
jgi:signal peptidase I